MELTNFSILRDLLWSLPTLKDLAMPIFWYFEKTNIFTRTIVFALFHDAIFSYACIEINKQLNWNVLQYKLMIQSCGYNTYYLS